MADRDKESSAMRPLSLVSTPLAERVNQAIAAKQWAKCERCGAKWEERLGMVVEGLCKQCRTPAPDPIALATERLNGVFGERTQLVKLALKDFITEPGNSLAYFAVERFDPKTDNLLLYGDVGSGKTQLACRAVARFAGHISCQFIRPSEWLRRLRGRSGIEEQQEIERLARVSLLVIDELGLEKTTDFSLQSLYDVIESRILREKNGLIVTSNLSLDNLSAKLADDRLPSRLGGLCQVVKVSGEDRR